MYDNLSPTRQPPSSPPAQLSRSISEIGGPAATKWDADRLHLYTRKGSDAARAAKTRGPVTRPSTLPITALNSREDAYKLLRENQTERFRLQNVDGVDSISTLCGSLQDHISLHWSLVNSVSSIRKKRSLLQCGMIDQRVYARLKIVTDEALRLEVFRPNSLTKPDNDYPLCNMRKSRKARVFFLWHW